MTENELKRCREEFEKWADEYAPELQHITWLGFQAAWQHQQAKIDELTQHINNIHNACHDALCEPIPVLTKEEYAAMLSEEL